MARYALIAHCGIGLVFLATGTYGQSTSTLCRFEQGPRAGQTQDYAPMAPLPVGTPCQDGAGSMGKVVAAPAPAGKGS